MAWWRRGGSETAAPRPDPAAPQQLSAPAQRAAWQDLPPLKPMLTATAPVAPLASFTASLSTARNPSFLAPLSHAVDPTGPSGQVDGLASPVTPAATSTGPELVIAPAPSALSQAVQRIRTPTSWLSVGEQTHTPSVQRQVAAGVADDIAPAISAPDEPRWLPTAPPAYRYELTSAPDPGVQHPLPVIATSPVAPAPPMTTGSGGVPTVSRQVVDGSVSGVVAPLQRETEQVVPLASQPLPLGGAQQTMSSFASDGQVPEAEAPLLGAAKVADSAESKPTGGEPSPVTAPEAPIGPVASANSTSSTAADWTAATSTGATSTGATSTGATSAATSTSAIVVSAAPPSGGAAQSMSPVQRFAGPASRSAGLGAPLRSVPLAPAPLPAVPSPPAPQPPAAQPATAGPVVQRAPTGPAFGAGAAQQSALQRAVPTATSPSPQPSPGSQSSSKSSSAATASLPVARTGSASDAPGVPADPAQASILGLSAVMRVFDQTQPAAAGERAVAGGGVVDAAPSTSTNGPTHRPVGLGAPISMSSQLLGPVQRHTMPSSPAGLTPAAAATGSTVPNGFTAQDVPAATQDYTELMLPAAVQRSVADAGPHTVDSGDVEVESAQSEQEPDPGTQQSAPLLGGLSVPLASAAESNPVTTPLAGVPSTGSVLPAVQRSQAPDTLAGFPATPAGPGAETNRVSGRDVSFEQMFAPGAAAIASGAAYADSPNSVVFRPPTHPTLGGATTVPAVQRFGLPSASSFVKQAQDAAGGYANQARQSVGGLANGAQQAAGGYADTARQAAGGYLDKARGAAGGYADQARQGAGGYADQALGLAGSAAGSVRGYADEAAAAGTGLLDSARETAGSAADRAMGAVTDAGSAASKAVGGAVDAASGAVSGATAAAGNAASGASAAVTGAAAGAAGAAAGAAGALPTDLNELARRLFDPLNDRFKTELWLDRERAGMVTDLRR